MRSHNTAANLVCPSNYMPPFGSAGFSSLLGAGFHSRLPAHPTAESVEKALAVELTVSLLNNQAVA